MAKTKTKDDAPEDLPTVAMLKAKFMSIPGGWHARNMFATWVEMMALVYANAVSQPGWKDREARYMVLVASMGRPTLDIMVELTGMLVLVMERQTRDEGFAGDVLGELFHELDLGNDRAGQFFTPMSVCTLMSEISLDDAAELLKDKPYITIAEPASGSGRAVLAAAASLKRQGFEPDARMLVQATDVDSLCFWMTYVNLTLAGIPAQVIHGNTLSQEKWATWYTIMYEHGRWRNMRQNEDGIWRALTKLEALLEYLAKIPPERLVTMDSLPSEPAPARKSLAERLKARRK